MIFSLIIGIACWLAAVIGGIAAVGGSNMFNMKATGSATGATIASTDVTSVSSTVVL